MPIGRRDVTYWKLAADCSPRFDRIQKRSCIVSAHSLCCRPFSRLPIKRKPVFDSNKSCCLIKCGSALPIDNLWPSNSQALWFAQRLSKYHSSLLDWHSFWPIGNNLISFNTVITPSPLSFDSMLGLWGNINLPPPTINRVLTELAPSPK
jgi:hypothetical protein